MECVQDSLWFALHHSQQSLGWTFRFAAALLPVLERAAAHAHERGKTCLGKSKPLTNAFYVGLCGMKDPGRFPKSFPNLSCLLNALAKAFKISVVHRLSVGQLGFVVAGSAPWSNLLVCSWRRHRACKSSSRETRN